MNKELLNEVEESNLLKFYTQVVNFYYKHKNWYVFVLMFAFLLGAPFALFEVNKGVEKILSYILIFLWSPGILFLLISAPTHFLTGMKLRIWAKKYKIDYNQEYLKFIYENQKK